MVPPVQYGGDEVSALVLDIGSSTVRAGYAGEDAPKAVFPTLYAATPNADGSRSYAHGNSVHLYRPHAVHRNFVVDGLVDDWQAAERALDHAFKDRMRLNTLEEFPLLATEPSWNSKANRELMCELAFERYQTPAYYAVDKAVMSAFASGKGSALIVDVGAESSSVIPVYDGFVLRKALQRQPLAGNLVSDMVLEWFKSSNISVAPHYLVKSKSPVEVGQPSNASLRTERVFDASKPDGATTESYHRSQELRVAHEFKESVLEITHPIFDDRAAAAKGSRVFEFPDGFSTNVGTVRCSIPEVLFNPQRMLPRHFATRAVPKSDAVVPSRPYSDLQGIARLVATTLHQIDPDLHAALLSNVVVTGGTTLIQGFQDRLQAELQALSSGLKVKISKVFLCSYLGSEAKIFAASSATPAERMHSSWLGGSILASLGTFHQLWIGKAEYDEFGKSIVNRRAK